MTVATITVVDPVPYVGFSMNGQDKKRTEVFPYFTLLFFFDLKMLSAKSVNSMWNTEYVN